MCKLLFSLFFMAFSLGGQIAAAAFALNFQPQDSTFGDNFYPDSRCQFPEFGPNLGCSPSQNYRNNANDPTPFLQELYIDPTTGYQMYHVLVGRPSDGFSQEVYIRANGPSWEGGAGSASLGDGLCRSGISWTTVCNAFDPLGQTHDNVFTGNASGNPTTVVMRQLEGGTWDGGTSTWSCGAGDAFCQQFLKDTMSQKPDLDLTVRDNAAGMTSTFSLDMRNSDYLTDTTAGALQSTVQFTANAAGSAGEFNYAQDVKPADSYVTGGLYKFTGSGPTNAFLNPYLYSDGNYIVDQNWSQYISPGP